MFHLIVAAAAAATGGHPRIFPRDVRAGDFSHTRQVPEALSRPTETASTHIYTYTLLRVYIYSVCVCERAVVVASAERMRM